MCVWCCTSLEPNSKYLYLGLFDEMIVDKMLVDEMAVDETAGHPF